MFLLASIFDNRDNALPAILIGNITQGIVHRKPTTLQIDLVLLMKTKSLVEQFSEYGVTFTYDELLRFKTSAAVVANEERSGVIVYSITT